MLDLHGRGQSGHVHRTAVGRDRKRVVPARAVDRGRVGRDVAGSAADRRLEVELDVPHVGRGQAVSPPSPEILWPAIGHLTAPADLPPRAISSASDATRLVCSDNDPYCPPGADRLYAEPLQISADQIPDGGHLSVDDGYGPWPSVLAWCLGATVPLTGATAKR